MKWTLSIDDDHRMRSDVAVYHMPLSGDEVTIESFVEMFKPVADIAGLQSRVIVDEERLPQLAGPLLGEGGRVSSSLTPE